VIWCFEGFLQEAFDFVCIDTDIEKIQNPGIRICQL
jgi:hypothetical protein